MSTERLEIASRAGTYAVEFREDTDWAAELAAEQQAVVIVDENAWRLHADGCLSAFDRDRVIEMPVDEEGKTFAMVAGLCDRLVERSAKKSLTVISIGGGITQDVTGFLASVLYRGVHWQFVPTTLLAQADSCIGGKTSLNHGRYKNLLGTWFAPERVIVHTGFITTLGGDVFASGLGEVVKLHVLGGEDAVSGIAQILAPLLRREQTALSLAVHACLRIKRGYIEEDEFDHGRRNLLNFGHCFGHAIESATEFAVPHGQAVVLGMILAGFVARERGLLSPALEGRLRDRLFEPVLTLPPGLGLHADAVVAGMRHDKKRTGPGLALVMCCDDYRFEQVADLSVEEARAALAELAVP